MSESSSGIESAGNNYLKDFSKPDGDACREDGTLKDASEMEWPNSPSETDFRDDSNLDDDSRRDASEDSISYQPLSKGKKRKHVISDDEDNDIIMVDLHDNSDSSLADEIQPRDKAGTSSTQRQFLSKAEKRKKRNTESSGESDGDSGESEKEEDGDTKKDTRKVNYLCFLTFVFLSLFSRLCFLIFVFLTLFSRLCNACAC